MQDNFENTATEVFPHAPITEGLIDIRVQLPGDITLADLDNLHSNISDEYPQKHERRMLQAKLELKDEKEPLKTTSFASDGFLFKNSTETQVVQYRLDGYSFSRLRPYTQWEEVFPEAWRLWEIYRDATKPLLVTRLAVRFINALEIPSTTFDCDEYLMGAPRIPKELPQFLERFFTQIVVPFHDRGAAAIITQALSERPDPTKTDIILDIDVFFEKNISPQDENIRGIFETLRNIKNKVFLSSITEKAKELFR